MNLLMKRLVKSIPQLNRRELTEDDFYKLCRKEKIILGELPLQETIFGYYTNHAGKSYIIINSKLPKFRWLEVAFHELGHHYLHAPVTQSVFFNSNKLFPKQEQEAQILAVLALIPLPVLQKIEEDPDIMFDYPLHLIEERIKIFKEHGI